MSLSFVPRCLILNIALAQMMVWCQTGGMPLSEPMMVNLLMLICVTRLQWVTNIRSRHIFVWVNINEAVSETIWCRVYRAKSLPSKITIKRYYLGIRNTLSGILIKSQHSSSKRMIWLNTSHWHAHCEQILKHEKPWFMYNRDDFTNMV